MTIIRNPSCAEEITQNTFFKAMTAKKQFKGNSSELTWLCGIAKHLAIDECRKNTKLSELDEAVSISTVDIEKATEDKKQLTILSTNFSDWSNDICFNANVYTLILIFGGIVGGGLLVYGIINMKRKRLK